MHRHLLTGFAAAALAATSSAQITFVDADPATNLTNADGTAMTLGSTHLGTDNIWTIRTVNTNGGAAVTSNDDTGEDSPMLRQTITGLLPGVDYDIYFYLWGHPTQNWRGRAEVNSAPPAALPPGYLTTGPSWSSDIPMQALAFDSFVGPNSNPNLGLQYDPTTYVEQSGHFVNSVVIGEGTAFMFEGHVGRHTADANGEIWVYVEDHPNGGWDNRTWFDGVGYEIAPLQYGSSCGVGEIGMTGVPHRTTDWTVDLTGGDANSLALCMLGFNAYGPFDVGAIGFTPGCFINVSLDLIDVQLTDANGDASYAGNIGTLPGTTPIPLYFQWATFDSNLAVTSTTLGLEAFFHW